MQHATSFVNLGGIRLVERSHILYDGIYVKFPEQVKPQRQKVDGGC